jgi:F-type H+-transporting ATPase subunit epsilon
MAEQFEFELVSPERLVFSQPVDMVVVPGAEGYFGVLARHAPLISALKPGTISIYEGGAVTQRIFVAGGFADVTGERCTVLAEEATPVSQLDRAQVDLELSAAASDIAGLPAVAGSLERQTAEARLEIARAKIEAITGSPAA